MSNFTRIEVKALEKFFQFNGQAEVDVFANRILRAKPIRYQQRELSGFGNVLSGEYGGLPQYNKIVTLDVAGFYAKKVVNIPVSNSFNLELTDKEMQGLTSALNKTVQSILRRCTVEKAFNLLGFKPTSESGRPRDLRLPSGYVVVKEVDDSSEYEFSILKISRHRESHSLLVLMEIKVLAEPLLETL